MDNNQEMLALLKQFAGIRSVEDFEPTNYLREFTNPDTKETYSDYPAKVRLGWFRMDNPDGRIETRTKKDGDAFVAQVRVYKDNKDEEQHFIAEATAQRTPGPNWSADAARAWAQTAALASALELAGYGINPYSREFTLPAGPDNAPPAEDKQDAADAAGSADAAVGQPAAASEETPVDKAMKVMCPITKHAGKTLGDLINLDPGALSWLAQHYKGNQEIKEAAQLICEHALKMTA